MFDKKTSNEASKTWINSALSGIEKEQFVLETLLDKKVLQPSDEKKVKKVLKKLLKLSGEIDEIILE